MFIEIKKIGKIKAYLKSFVKTAKHIERTMYEENAQSDRFYKNVLC